MKVFVCKALSCLLAAAIPFAVVISAQQKLNQSNEILYATVTSPEMEFIQNLKQENFLLTDGKKALKIVGSVQNDEPISVGILLDISASNKAERGGKMDKTKWARENIPVFLKNSNPQNEYFLATFAGEYNILSDYTSNINDLQNILRNDSKFPLKGSTYLFDALKYGIENLSQAHREKRVLILVSDGLDTKSATSYGKIRELIKDNDVTVYLVDITILSYGYSSRLREDSDQTRNLVRISGGEALTAKTLTDTKTIFLYLSTLLRNQYRIEFEKSLVGDGDKWRDVDLKLNLTKDEEKRVGKPRVRTRTGYRVLK